MMLRLAWTAFLTLVTCSLAEQHLRGQSSSPSSLVTDASPIAPRLTSAGKHKSLLGMARGMFTPQENFHALTDLKEFGFMDTFETIVTFCIWLTCYFLFALYYHQQVRFRPPTDEEKAENEKLDGYKDFQEFRSGLCDCDQTEITFWSCICPGLRWADTMSRTTVHGFWSAFWLLTVLYCISFIPIATGFCYLIVACYMTYHRQEFRNIFSFHEQGGITWATDCLSYCCCMCCTVAQEARQCRDAISIVHPAINAPTPRLQMFGYRYSAAPGAFAPEA